MSALNLFLTDTVSVIPTSDGAVDEYNVETTVEGAPRVYRARVEQRSATERTQDGDVQLSDWVAYLPKGAQVAGRDIVLYGGARFEVVGPPNHHSGPLGGLDHVEVSLRHVSG